MSWLSKALKGVGKIAKTVAPFASFIPGLGTTAKVILGGLGGSGGGSDRQMGPGTYADQYGTSGGTNTGFTLGNALPYLMAYLGYSGQKKAANAADTAAGASSEAGGKLLTLGDLYLSQASPFGARSAATEAAYDPIRAEIMNYLSGSGTLSGPLQSLSDTPDWSTTGQTVYNNQLTAGDIGLNRQLMNQEAGQVGDLSSRGLLEKGYSPDRYWYGQERAKNIGSAYQTRLGVESTLRNEGQQAIYKLLDAMSSERTYLANNANPAGAASAYSGAAGNSANLAQLFGSLSASSGGWADILGKILAQRKGLASPAY